MSVAGDGTVTVLDEHDETGAKFIGCRIKPQWRGGGESKIESFFIFPLRKGRTRYRIPWGEDKDVSDNSVHGCIVSKNFIDQFLSPGDKKEQGLKLMDQISENCNKTAENGDKYYVEGSLRNISEKNQKKYESCELKFTSIPDYMFSEGSHPDTVVGYEPGSASDDKELAEGAFLAVRYEARREPTIFVRIPSGAFTATVVATHWVDLESESENTLVEFVYPKPSFPFFRQSYCCDFKGRFLGRTDQEVASSHFDANPFVVLRQQPVKQRDETSITVEYKEIGASGKDWFEGMLTLTYMVVLGRYLGDLWEDHHSLSNWRSGILAILFTYALFLSVLAPLARRIWIAGSKRWERFIRDRAKKRAVT